MSDAVVKRGREREGAGRPFGAVSAAKDSADRIRLTRQRRKLARLRPEAVRGIVAVMRMGPKALGVLDGILNDPEHPDRTETAKYVAKLNQEVRREIFDRTGLVRRVELDAEGGVVVLSQETLLQAMQQASERVTADSSKGVVEAEYRIVPNAKGNGTVQ